jgi:hypothetical protein
MPNDFQIAYERARRRAGEAAWAAMSTRARTDAIYEAMRELDADRVERWSGRSPATSGGDAQ